MADSIQLGAGEQPASGTESTDNNAGAANQPGAGESSAPLMARPDWVPEKFFKDGVIDYKGMASSYSELEKKQGQQPTGEPKAGDEPKPEDKPVPPAPAIPGVTPERVTHFTEEITKGGKLSDASYEELAKLGYPKPVVDAYVRGLNADAEVSTARLAESQLIEIQNSVGGTEKLGEMIGWAKANWSADDQRIYNEAVSSGDVAKVRNAVKGLKTAYDSENGEEPQYLGGRKPAGVDGITPYASEEDVARDMGKPEYKNSEEFRQKVYARLKVSNVFAQSQDYTKVKR
jgi:hypothetical protein